MELMQSVRNRKETYLPGRVARQCTKRRDVSEAVAEQKHVDADLLPRKIDGLILVEGAVLAAIRRHEGLLVSGGHCGSTWSGRVAAVLSHRQLSEANGRESSLRRRQRHGW